MNNGQALIFLLSLYLAESIKTKSKNTVEKLATQMETSEMIEGIQ